MDARSSGTSPPSALPLHELLLCVFLECVRRYIARAGRGTNWALVARSTAAAQLLLSQTTRPPREWVRFLLRSRETFGEFHHLVRDLRLDDGRDFFAYFRMTRQRYVHTSVFTRLPLCGVAAVLSRNKYFIVILLLLSDEQCLQRPVDYQTRDCRWNGPFSVFLVSALRHENMFAIYELASDHGRFLKKRPMSALVLCTDVHYQDL